MRKFFVRNGNKHQGIHNIYESAEEFHKDFPGWEIFKWARDDYTRLKDGMWVESEDGYILECLAFRKLTNKSGQTTFVYRFPNYLGTVYIRTDGTPKFSKFYGNITSLDSSSMSKFRRIGNPEVKIKFAAFVAAGLPLRKAYYLAFSKKNSKPISVSDNTLLRLMNDKLVINQLKDHLAIFRDKIDDKFSVQRLIDEIDTLLTSCTKGSDAHRKNIQFVMDLKGMLPKPLSKKELEDADYEEVPPFNPTAEN